MAVAIEPVIGIQAEVWRSIEDACQGLSDAGWNRPTDCPGWTVRDLLSHLIGLELVLLGGDLPAAPDPSTWPAHVRNEFGAAHECFVEERRDRPGPEVLAEFVDVTARRRRQLDAMAPAAFDEVGPSPVGIVPYRELLRVRVFDCWVHEQDARRALDRPGGRGGGGEEEALRRVASAMGRVVARGAAAPDGTVAVWVVEGPLPRSVTVRVDGGRGHVEDRPGRAAPGSGTSVRFELGAEDFWRLGCGRVAAEEVVADGRVVVGGDRQLGRRILDAMNFMF